jgi:hypothetical protein
VNTSENWTVFYGGRDAFQLVVRFLTCVNLQAVTDVSCKHVTPSSVYMDIHPWTSKMEAACFAATSVLTLKPTCRQNPELYCWKSNVHAYYCISLFIYAKSVHIATVALKGPYLSRSDTRYKNIIQLISDSYEILSERITDESYQLPCFLNDMSLLIFYLHWQVKLSTQNPRFYLVVSTRPGLDYFFLIVVLPCMLTITQLLLQQNAHFYY